jgi:hypothetical protein
MKHNWNILRLTTNYFSFYGFLAQVGLPAVSYYVRKWRKETPLSVPLATMTNVGIISQELNSESKSSRPPLWSNEDLQLMPKVSAFLGGVTDPAPFPHYIFASSMFSGKLHLSAAFSKFAIPPQESVRFMNQVVQSIFDGDENHGIEIY